MLKTKWTQEEAHDILKEASEVIVRLACKNESLNFQQCCKAANTIYELLAKLDIQQQQPGWM